MTITELRTNRYHRTLPIERDHAPRPLGGRSKRILDVVLALTALVLAAPIIAFISILIRATAKEPAIFSHTRVGFNGKPFACYKFRTMRPNSDQALAAYLSTNPDAAREWEQNRKLKHDPRVTPLGHVLRKSSLDELPQLLNVLRGEMSCVGPRPIVADELQRYGPYAGDYLQTRPGITGLWQVMGRDAIGYEGRVTMDSMYVRNWSVRADLAILVRTVFAVMRFDRTS
jgi:exopolysaccharide production protein ExoY